jgi:cyclic pyranopterin phosphate synthase
MDDWQPPETAPPSEGPLLDTFGRVADDLRISVTDRCNFRCVFCMPAEGLKWLPKDEILTFEELTRLLGIFVSLGVRSIKVTGGEPTVRADLPTLVSMFREAGPELDMSMTTNGILLDRLAEPLARAGLDRVTVSCHSLMPHRFEGMTRRDALDKVFAGLRAAQDAGLTPIKINCVVIGGENQDEVVDFATWARQTGYVVRFIEYMPLDAEHAWERAKVVPSSQIVDAIDRVFPLASEGPDHEPAATYRFADGAPGGIGVIASVTEPFCETCNRLRMTAEGQVRSCLFALEELDLREPLRGGATDGELASIIRTAVWRKWSGHRINHPDFVQPERSMSMIGG